MSSLHMQNSDDYQGGKFDTSASVKWTTFLGGRVRFTFASERNSLIERGTKILSSLYQFGYTIEDFFYKFLNLAFKSPASLIHLNN